MDHPSSPSRSRSVLAFRRDRTLGELLAERRIARFTGREPELASLGDALARASDSPTLAVISGAPGVGKSTLARRFGDDARRRGAGWYWIGGDAAAPSPRDVLERLAAQGLSTLEQLGHGDAADVLVVDAFERFIPVARWFFETELVRAGTRLVVVLTTRQRLDPRLRAELSMGLDLLDLPLAELSEAESRAALERGRVPQGLHDEICAASRGNPLLLSLFAERYAGSVATHVHPDDRARALGALRDLACDAPTDGPPSLPSTRSASGQFALEIGLDEEAFGRAVREALPLLHRRHRLKESALVEASMVGATHPIDRVAAADRLSALIVKACRDLAASPGTELASRVLEVTFVRPSGKQQAAASAVRMPYGTYRHHLRASIDVLTKELWELERAARRVRVEAIDQPA